MNAIVTIYNTATEVGCFQLAVGSDGDGSTAHLAKPQRTPRTTHDQPKSLRRYSMNAIFAIYPPLPSICNAIFTMVGFIGRLPEVAA
jgi:hypothetical protein